MTLSDIQEKIIARDFRYSDHAITQMIQKTIERNEVESAILSGEIIEEYPDDRYSPSCLFYGKTNSGRDLHAVVSFPPKVVIITTYQPDEHQWLNFRIRK